MAAPLVGVALASGVLVSWQLGRREASEIEDVLGWAMAAALTACFAALVLFIVLYVAGGAR
jgi:Na+-driven multidrug efflux pump